MRLILKNANLFGLNTVDLAIVDTQIVEIGKDLVGDELVDCSGLVLLPGLVDLHTHLREPGFEASETVLTGSKSAAKGGFTAVFAMANSFPVADTAGVVNQVRRLGESAGYVEVRPVGAISKGLEGKELAALGAMASSEAAVTLFSDDGMCVDDPLLMRRAMEYLMPYDAVIAQHAQDPRLTPESQMNEGALSVSLGLKGWPAVAEESIIARDCLLSELTGARLHICHVTTAGGVEIIRWAKRRGIRVTAEVTPHHLLLTEDLVKGYDPLYKVNPPLRTEHDVLALREALIDGTIDIIGTDHAPHASEYKDVEWEAAAFGMQGLETAASIAQLVLIQSGKSTWARFSEVLSSKPAEIGQLSNHGRISEGQEANLVLIDPEQTRVVGAASESKSENTPFVGMELPGAVVHTIFRGRFTVKNGKIR